MSAVAERIDFALVGAGWRAEFYLRIAAALPELFRVAGVVVRDDARRDAVARRWGVPVHASVAELVERTQPLFAVVAVPKQAAAGIIETLAAAGIPALTETPPGDDLAAMAALHDLVRHGARIQVAEQYHLEPLLSAQLALARSGVLGRVDQAQVGLAHDFHGISVMRRALGIGFEDATVHAWEFDHPLVKGPTRVGDPTEEATTTATQVTARFDFGDRLGVYDFAPQQYRSWIRSNRILIRGPRGEIHNSEVRYLKEYLTPMVLRIERLSAGEDTNLQGLYLRGLVAGGEWLYRNPFVPARLMDDELAIATALTLMAGHAQGGPGFYDLAEAAQDYYLYTAMRESILTGQPVTTRRQPWAQTEAEKDE